jgi:hypothetical protein
LVVAVVIDEPMIAHHGGTVAAPTFRRIMEASLRQLGVVPRLPEDARASREARKPSKQKSPDGSAAAQKSEPAQKLEADERLVPDLLGRNARAALRAAHDIGLSLVLAGSGVVSAQKPAAGEVCKVGATLEVTLEPPEPEAPATPAASPASKAAPQAEVATATKERRDG